MKKTKPGKGNARLSKAIWIKSGGKYLRVLRDKGHSLIQEGRAEPCNRRLIKRLKSEEWVEKEGVLHAPKTGKRSSS